LDRRTALLRRWQQKRTVVREPLYGRDISRMKAGVTTLLLPHVIAGPYREEKFAFAATLCLSQFAGEHVWLALCKPGHADPILASRMLALLALHPTHPLVHPVLIPTAPAPAMAFFMPGGYWSDHRNLNYPEEVRAEVDRIAEQLRLEHPQYLADFVSALKGERPTSFSAIPEGLGIADPANENSLVTPRPVVAINEDSLGKWGTPELYAQLVAIDYRKERYLEGFPKEDLTGRAVDAVINMLELEGERTLVVNFGEAPVLDALARLGEVMEEMRLREGPLPETWYAELAAKWGGVPGTPERTRRALTWIQSRKAAPVGGLVRFGRIDHLEAALKTGSIRLGPASMYADPSLSRAQLANELAFDHHVDTRRHRFELWDETNTKKLADLDPIKPTITRRAATDAYVLSFTRRISARLFHAFQADGCLLIHDESAFKARLADATRLALPGWEMLALDVRYVDSFSPEGRNATPLFVKPASHQYQREHRILWLPPAPAMNLTPVFVELGSLTDIAELVRIDVDA
jgi:hypothetical protein